MTPLHPLCVKLFQRTVTHFTKLFSPRPEELQPLILSAFNNTLDIFSLSRLNYAAGAFYAEAANTLLEKVGLQPSDIDVIGYDGQTIYMEPPDRAKEVELLKTQASEKEKKDGNSNNNDSENKSSSLVDLFTRGGYSHGIYLVEAGVVAALTDIDVVSQFRAMDQALGGNAAPLMPHLDFVSFRGEGHPVCTLNIGGIANLQLANADRREMMAFDTGPGNVMIDHVARVRTGKGYDEDGMLAGQGRVIEDLLVELQGHEFFTRRPPRSAWRLDFGAGVADDILHRYTTASTEDLLATVTMLTAVSIERALDEYILPRFPITRLVASGGGTRNKTLMGYLSELLAKNDVELCTSDVYGLPSQFKEAIKFAVLAFSAKRGIANNIPYASGALRYAVMGKLSTAPSKAKFGGEVEGRNDRILRPYGWPVT